MKNELRIETLIALTLGHLATQGQQAWSEVDESCMYRAGELKCAAGFWIPDYSYAESIEGLGIDSLAWRLDPQYEWTDELIQQLRKLQLFHDLKNIWESPDIFYGTILGIMKINAVTFILVGEGPDFNQIGYSELRNYIHMHWKGTNPS